MEKFYVDADISVAKTLHTSFYLDPDLFRHAKEKIFTRTWQFVGDTNLIATKNDCYPVTLLPKYLDEPLVLTKDGEERIHCLSNVCTHRGNLVVKKACNQPHLRCNYHGRLFNHDGRFRSMPEFGEVKNFPTEADDLSSLPLHRWGNWLFTSIDNPLPGDLFFQEMSERLSWLPLEDFKHRPELDQTFTVNAHWALYCENYLEGFHIPFVHAGLNSVIDFGSYTTELFEYSSLQLGLAKREENCFDLPETSVDFGRRVAAYYFFVFPNMMFNFYPWGLSLNIVEPVALDKTNIRFVNYVWKDELLGKGAGSGLDTVEMEDEEAVEAVQLGIRSRFYSHGRYSVNREQGTHHFHRMLCSVLNDQRFIAD